MISQRTAKKIKEEFGYDFLLMSWEEISRYKGLCKYKGLCEAFIEKYIDRVNWYFISIYQKLFENFIEKYADKVNWNCISRYQVITPEFADKHNIKINNNSQRTATEWKKMIEETNLYECHKDYFYAYKSIRSNRYSHFNFQYQYLPGESYDCFSDYSDDENSFGLSAG